MTVQSLTLPKLLLAEKWLLEVTGVSTSNDMPYELLRSLYPDVLALPEPVQQRLLNSYNFKGNTDLAFLYSLVAYALKHEYTENFMVSVRILDILESQAETGKAYLRMVTNIMEKQRMLMTSAADVLLLEASAHDLMSETMDISYETHAKRVPRSTSLHALTVALIMTDEHWIATAHPYIEECAKQKEQARKLVQEMKDQLVTGLS